MKFQCFVCDDKNPCNLITKYVGDVPPTICPFKTEILAVAEWKKELPKGAKNTEQANQPDSQYDLGGLIIPGSMWAEQ